MEFIGEVRWCESMLTAVCQDRKPKRDALEANGVRRAVGSPVLCKILLKSILKIKDKILFESIFKILS